MCNLKKNVFLIVFFSPGLVFARAEVGFNFQSYLTESVIKSHLDHYLSMEFAFEDYHQYSRWGYGFKGLSSVSLDQSRENNFAMPALFASYKIDDLVGAYDLSIVLGRQIYELNKTRSAPHAEDDQSTRYQIPEPWSYLDDLWTLGLWQSYIRWDMLQPKKQGLTGLFFSTNNTHWSMTLFLSWLFLPYQGPSVGFTPEGKIDFGRSRWITFSQTDYTAFSRKIEVLYWMEKIYLKNIILNKSLAAKLRLGDVDKHWINGAFAYKPVNKIYFRVNPMFTIEKLAIENTIQYELFNHYLFSADAGIKRRWWTVIASFSQEIPEKKVFSSEWMITPYLPDTLLLSAYFLVDIEEVLKFYFLEEVAVKFLYSKINKTLIKQEGIDLLPNVDIDINKYQILYGVAAEFSGSFFKTIQHNLFWKGEYMYSIVQKGGWLHFMLGWKIKDRLSIISWVDILGVNPGGEKGFFSSYQTNDRIGLKINYEFF